ncbi:hypothetical protein Gohar_003964 [Gossypium harknessii]|uniref:Uncharacterized protein n=1 Tax=Gossypium harknessii TaxID=34285 RepID=A0A7J9H3F3_9ROSI|nr:hypothetical protein [Gossypium harknessii]
MVSFVQKVKNPERMTYDQRDSALASWLIKMICDNLVMCGEKISDTEHISAILNGLTPDYESVTALPFRPRGPSFVRATSFMRGRAELVFPIIDHSVTYVGKLDMNDYRNLFAKQSLGSLHANTRMFSIHFTIDSQSK